MLEKKKHKKYFVKYVLDGNSLGECTVYEQHVWRKIQRPTTIDLSYVCHTETLIETADWQNTDPC